MGHDHLIPNTTQVPNAIIDLLMPFLHDGEARILMYLCRRTYGFQREADSISLPQFVDGIRSGERQLDFGAGVSRQGAMNALAVLKAIGIVEQIEGGRGRGNIPVFRINLKCEMVQWLDLIREEPETAREKIVERIDLIRNKGLPYGPFHKKPAPIAEPEEKVKRLDLSGKVEIAQEKGLTVRPTKPSSTKPRKETTTPLTPQVLPDEPISPSGADEAKVPRSKKDYSDYPGFCQLWEMAVSRPGGSKGQKEKALNYWKKLRIENNPSLLNQILDAYAYQKTTPKWQEQGGLYVKELQSWIFNKVWEGVSVPAGFNRQTAPPTDAHGYLEQQVARLEREDQEERERRRART